MIDLRRRRAGAGLPIVTRLRRLVFLLGALVLLVCVTAIGALQVEVNEVNQLTLAVGPAFDANRQVLQVMTDAETGLRGYEVSRDRQLLAPYEGADARTMAALASTQDKLALARHDTATAAVYANLQGAQRFAVSQWFAYAVNTEHGVAAGDPADVVLRGRVLFDRFRRANAALDKRIRAERDQTVSAVQTRASEGMAVTIVATLVALVMALLLGYRAAQSMSRPMIDLREAMNRQRAGDSGARAREDQGSLELRSLGADFNALTDRNLDLQQTQALSLRMHQLTIDIGHAIQKISGTQQALDVLCAALGEGLNVDRVLANTIDAEHTVLLGAQWHRPDLNDLGNVPDDLEPHVGGLAEQLWLSSERLVSTDFLAEQVPSSGRARIFYRETGARAIVMVPIGLGDRVLGAICVLTVDGPRRWATAEVNTVQQVVTFMGRIIVETDYRVQQSEHVARLERLDRQKTDFLSTVSHELRTPLTSITGYLEVLQDEDAGELDAQQRRMLEVIDRNATRLRSLIEDLLILNRIESSGLKVNVAPVSFCELITHTAQELAPLAHKGAVELDVDAGPGLAIVEGDQGHLQRAIVNLVSNAIKFSHPKGVVSIKCTVDETTHRVLFTCQDQGIGIPAEDQPQLFTRFYRASNAQNQAIPGTGLGLNIVKQIVEDHNGELRLASVEGEGTTVVIDLPLSIQTLAVHGNDAHDPRSST